MKFCCYGTMGWDIGKVIEEHKCSDGSTSVTIRYYPDQMYPNELWDGKYVKIFNNFKEAKKFYLDNTSIWTRRMSVIEDWEKHIK